MICSFIAHANPPMDGAENRLASLADKINLDGKPMSDSEEKSDDNSSERPVKYATSHALNQFAIGLGGGMMREW